LLSSVSYLFAKKLS